MHARTSALSILVALSAGVAGAQLGPGYTGWAKGPEGFLLTKKEAKEWEAVTSDAAAERFIELFWARRDPNLQTLVNELKVEFDRRVQYADDKFSFEGTRGALSDRGRVLIVMGFPDKSERRGPTQTVERMDDLGYGTDEVRANAELWLYDPARLPTALKVKGNRLLYVFYEHKAETNEYVLDRSHPEATRALRALGDMPEIYLVHPDLTEAPKPVAVHGGVAADQAHLEWLKTTSARWSDKVKLVLEPGVADATFRPLWAQVIVPLDAPLLDELAGRVSTPDGKVAGTFQVNAKPMTAGQFKVYHLTFPLAAGKYRVEIAGGSGGEVQFVSAGDAELASIPAEGTWMSPLWIGVSAQREESALLGAAYVFGGWHLVPLVGDAVSKKDELSYFGFIAHPGLNDAGATAVTAEVVLKQGDKRLGPPLKMSLATKELTPGLYLYANSLTLGGLPATGEYLLEFTITDGLSNVTTGRAVTIDLAE